MGVSKQVAFIEGRFCGHDLGTNASFKPASGHGVATPSSAMSELGRSIAGAGCVITGFFGPSGSFSNISQPESMYIYIYCLYIIYIYTYIYTFYLHMIYFICVGESRVLHGFILPMVWWTTRSKMMLLQFTCSTCWFCFGPTPPPRTQSSPPGLRQFLVRNSWNKPFICHRVWYRYNTYLSKTSQT